MSIVPMDLLPISYWTLFPERKPGYDGIRFCRKHLNAVRYGTAIIGYRPEWYVKEFTV